MEAFDVLVFVVVVLAGVALSFMAGHNAGRRSATLSGPTAARYNKLFAEQQEIIKSYSELIEKQDQTIQGYQRICRAGGSNGQPA